MLAQVLPLLVLALGLCGSLAQPVLVEVESQALVDAAGANLARLSRGGAWLDVEGDGDMDFVLSGDPAKGIHLQWLRNVERGTAFQAVALDSFVEDLPDASVSEAVGPHQTPRLGASCRLDKPRRVNKRSLKCGRILSQIQRCYSNDSQVAEP